MTTGYRPQLFVDPAAETQRLAAQAEAALAVELPAYHRVGFPESGRVLDVGCGPGFVSRALRARGYEVVGVDASADLLTLAEPPVARADALALPFADQSFDVAFARLVLQHLPDPRRALRELLRVTRVGGHVVVVDGDEASIAVAPAPEGFEEVRAQRRAWLSERGIDADAGRSLKRWLAEVGADTPRVALLTFDSETLGAAAFGAIVLAPYYGAAGRDGGDALRAWAQKPGAFGFAHLVVAGARRG